MIKLAVIADDLTGANDTALQFSKRQMRAFVQIEAGEAPPESDVIVLDTDSRELAPKEAYAKVRSICEAVRESRPACVYKKVDSTLRGSWGAEVAAADDVCAPDLVVIAPAYPALGRVTRKGRHLLGGVPLELTEIARAPKTPVRESHIPSLLARHAPGRRTAVLAAATLHAGEAAVRSAVQGFLAEGCRWLVCDIEETADFDLLVHALRLWAGEGKKKEILWVGSAGLADHIAAFYGWQGGAKPALARREGPILFFAGSVSHTTQQQIRVLKEAGGAALVRLSAERIIEDAAAADHYAAAVCSLLAAGENVLLASAQQDADVAEAVHIGRAHGLSGRAVSDRVAELMAKIAARLDLAQLAGFVATGGDTAVHICRAIGAQRIEVLAEVEPGVPLGRIEGAAEPIYIVTKAGAFGSPEAFVRALAAIRRVGAGSMER